LYERLPGRLLKISTVFLFLPDISFIWMIIKGQDLEAGPSPP